MPNRPDEETLKIPAFMRNKAIVSQAKQKLILTALDRKEAGLSVYSKKATAPIKKPSRIRRRFASTTKKSLYKNPNQMSPYLRQELLQTEQEQQEFDRHVQLIQSKAQAVPSPTAFHPQNNIQLDYGSEVLSPNQTQNDFAASQSFSSPANPELPQTISCIGKVTHYLGKIDVAIIKLTGTLKVGDKIYLQNESGLFLQEVSEIQIERIPVMRAISGDHIGLKTSEPVIVESSVFKP